MYYLILGGKQNSSRTITLDVLADDGDGIVTGLIYIYIYIYIYIVVLNRSVNEPALELDNDARGQRSTRCSFASPSTTIEDLEVNSPSVD